MNDKAYTIYEVMEIIKENKELIFEIRKENEYFKNMLLICSIGLSGAYFLKYYQKPKDNWSDKRWELADYIPLSEEIKWYISKFTKTDVQNSIDEYGIRS